MNTRERQSNHFSKVMTGFLIVIFGVLWLMNNLGMLNQTVAHYLFSWKILLIGIGLIMMTCKNKSIFPGFITILVGAAFIAKDFVELPIDAFQLIVPSVVILIGLYVIFKKKMHMNKPHKVHEHFKNKEYVDMDKIDEVNIFGGRKIQNNSQNFSGGNSVSIFGGCEIDLTLASLADGVSVIESVSIFGGVVYIIPRDWNVKVEVMGIMGGFSDKRFAIRQENIDYSKTLIIRGVAIFGGGELKTM